MAKNHEKFPYAMECEITVIVFEDGIEKRKVLNATFPLTKEAVKEPWYVLTNHLAPAYVEKKLGRQGTAWKRIYERRIIRVWYRGDKDDRENSILNIPLRVMTFDQLNEYCKKKELRVNPNEFHNIEVARRFVQLYQDDPTAYEMQYAEYKAGEHRQKPEFDEYRRSVEEIISLMEEEENAVTSKGGGKGKQAAGNKAAGKKDTEKKNEGGKDAIAPNADPFNTL